jgi:hypothetical protein
MTRSRLTGSRRGSLLQDDTRAMAFEFAFIATVIGIIVGGAFHLIGVNLYSWFGAIFPHYWL